MTDAERHDWLNLLAAGRGEPPPYPAADCSHNEKSLTVAAARLTTALGGATDMTRANHAMTTHILHDVHEEEATLDGAALDNAKLEKAVLAGLKLLDVTIRQHAHDVANGTRLSAAAQRTTWRVDIPALCLLRALDGLPADTTVGAVLDILTDLHEQPSAHTPEAVAATQVWQNLTDMVARACGTNLKGGE